MKLKPPLRLGLLLTAIGILLMATATAQPRRNHRNGNSGNRLKAMMERFDANRDGVITRNEFKGSPERFSRMDSNGDDKVDGAELKAMRNRMQQSNRNGGGSLARRYGVDKSPEVGEKAPDFTLQLLHSKKTVTLSEAYRDKPVALTLGSYTCPPYRRALEGINALSQQYSDEFAFYFVYIKEAHAADEWASRGNQRLGIDFKQPTTYLERERIAKTCQQQIELTMPILVDTLDNAVERRFAAAPNRTYLIDQNGIVVYKGVRGPQGTRPEEVAKAIRKQLQLKTEVRTSADQTESRGSE